MNRPPDTRQSSAPSSNFFCGHEISRLTINQILKDRAAEHPDKAFLKDIGSSKTFSYCEGHRITNELANGLLGQGLAKGGHVAILMDNCAEMLFLLFALAKAGAVAIPINAAARGDQLAYFLKQSDSSAIIISSHYSGRVADILGEVPAIKHVVVVGDDDDEALNIHRPRIVAYKDLLTGNDADVAEPPHFLDLSMICYTSGTTGPSKGCMFRQCRPLLWGASNADSHGYQKNDTFYVCLPMFHVTALHGQIFAALMLGATIALSTRFSVRSFWREIRETGSTVSSLQGTIAQMLLDQPANEADRRHDFRVSHISPMPQCALAFEQRFGTKLVGGYGLTDFWASHSFTAVDPTTKLGSMGRPRRGIDTRIVDENELDVVEGRPGHLLLRNNNVWQSAEGYYKFPSESLSATRNGWFHTGDIVSRDQDGFFWFVGRDKDMIRRRGENVSAFEIERIVLKHKAIAEVAAFPVASATTNEDVAIVVVRHQPGDVDERQLLDFCIKNMAYYMVPRYIKFVDELPKNLTFKVLKYQLQQDAEAHRTEFWDREIHGIVVTR